MFSISNSAALSARTAIICNRPDIAAQFASESVHAARSVGAYFFLPRTLLIRAEASWTAGRFQDADDDLAEVASICSRTGLKLFEADCFLLRARMAESEADRDSHLRAAHQIVTETKYNRRLKDIEQLSKRRLRSEMCSAESSQ